MIRARRSPTKELDGTYALEQCGDLSDNKDVKNFQQQKHLIPRLRHVMLSYVLLPLYNFLHARTNVQGCRLTGYIRVCYALLFLFSRFFLFVELPFLMDPIHGVMPYAVTSQQLSDYSRKFSLFEAFPDSSLVLYGLYTLGYLHGILLLVGFFPRVQAIGVFIFLTQLHKHDDTLWDNQEIMLRMWAFMLAWLPLDHITYLDGFGGWLNPHWLKGKYSQLRYKLAKQSALSCRGILAHNWVKLALSRDWIKRFIPPKWMDGSACRGLDDNGDEEAPLARNDSFNYGDPYNNRNQTTSWPMWPFRFWQIYICVIYMGAGWGKLVSEPWFNGYALLYCWYEDGFGRFFPSFVTENLFNRMGPIQFMTYASLLVESLCMITIWPLATRFITFVAIVLLHIGIELALIMHIFEYLSVLGWVCFFVFPNDDTMIHSTKDMQQKVVQAAQTFRRNVASQRLVLDSIVALSVLSLLVVSAFPSEVLLELTSRPFRPLVRYVIYKPMQRAARQVQPVLAPIGLYSGVWTLFAGKPTHTNAQITAVIHFHEDNDQDVQPIVWMLPEWMNYSLYERERYYWSEDYYYYIMQEKGVETIPFFASLAMYLSEQYSNGTIAKDDTGKYLEIHPDNKIASISFMGHWERGDDPPGLKDLGWWDKIPRSYSYSSMCTYALVFPRPNNHNVNHVHPRRRLPRLDASSTSPSHELSVSELLKYDEDEDFEEQNGCRKFFTKADLRLHQKAGRPKTTAAPRRRRPERTREENDDGTDDDKNKDDDDDDEKSND